MDALPPSLRRRVAAARVARFSTLGEDGPAIVPICFVLREGTLYHVLDRKPKRVEPAALRRVRNLARDPRCAAIVDQYDEDWGRLWFVAFEGRARLLTAGAERQAAVLALKRKYAQYRRMALEPDAIVIALDVGRTRFWQATPRRPGARPATARVDRSGSTRSRSTDRRSGH
ncbi:MAG TPA: TIGR03668 family PPOX class F420-dependent oxidoreductase [Candidatus Limnocylindrales bacterium]|nr:TIGR03668 family PPOX class F420-dependent oxidoreductase [Candidatus Limnocylindrales bacterium]